MRQLSVMRTPVCAPAPGKEGSAMQERGPFKQPDIQRLSEQAAKLRKEAQGTPPGIERERLIRRARQAESASEVNGWLNSRDLRPPK
jgi:hypothetical protein